MQEALMFVLKDLLKSSWTEETADAWNKLFQFITEHMVYGLQSWSTRNSYRETELLFPLEGNDHLVYKRVGWDTKTANSEARGKVYDKEKKYSRA